MKIILTKKFEISDQLDFAKFSGDYNPMHVDEISSRRFLYGRPVVHGINLVLCMLDSWASINRKKNNFSEISVIFSNPVFLNCDVIVKSKTDLDSIYLELTSNNDICVKLYLKLNSELFLKQNSLELINDFPKKNNAIQNDFSSISEMEGKLDFFLHHNCFDIMFPSLKRYSNWFQVSALLTSTRLVGMECPGLNSIFSGLNFSFDFKNLDTHYNVNKLNRFGLVNIEFKGTINGSIKAFVRPNQVNQLKFNEIKKFVEKDEFKNQYALIIGGSRGIGEVTAKILAAGGATVLITYSKGESDAKNIIDDINLNGGIAKMIHYDIYNHNQFNSIDFKPTDLYYFATPSIISGKKGIFDIKLFNLYSFFYISAFHQLVSFWTEKNVTNYFYPSSIYVDEMPENMFEYSMSKLSGENICDVFIKKNEHIKIYKPRLPRLETDQTVSFVPMANNNTLESMLKWLRKYNIFKNSQLEL